MEWRTIESAPRDGTPILIWDIRGYPIAARWHEKAERWVTLQHYSILVSAFYGDHAKWMPMIEGPPKQVFPASLDAA